MQEDTGYLWADIYLFTLINSNLWGMTLVVDGSRHVLKYLHLGGYVKLQRQTVVLLQHRDHSKERLPELLFEVLSHTWLKTASYLNSSSPDPWQTTHSSINHIIAGKDRPHFAYNKSTQLISAKISSLRLCSKDAVKVNTFCETDKYLLLLQLHAHMTGVPGHVLVTNSLRPTLCC